jgi:subtilase family serine protease
MIKLPPVKNYGEYYLITVLDHDDDFIEINEDNNVKVNLISVEESRIDLEAGSPLSVADSVYRTNTFKTTLITLNCGNTLNYSTQMGVYLSIDTILSSEDKPLYTSVIYNLAPGEKDSRTIDLAVPNSVETGSYYLLYIIDSDNTIVETNESNNLVFNRVELLPEFIPNEYDLVITSFETDTNDVYAGDQLKVGFSCLNSGMDILNTAVYYRLYFSEDSILDINDLSRQLYFGHTPKSLGFIRENHCS